jgi:flagellar hook assembly protein FlgD
VDARVFDVTGRAVRTLVDGQLERGYHLLEWNGADASGRRVANGVYFVRLRTGQHDESRKVVLLQ